MGSLLTNIFFSFTFESKIDLSLDLDQGLGINYCRRALLLIKILAFLEKFSNIIHFFTSLVLVLTVYYGCCVQFFDASINKKNN